MPRHRLTNFRGPAFFVDESEVVQICKLICVDYTANMQLQGQLRKEKAQMFHSTCHWIN